MEQVINRESHPRGIDADLVAAIAHELRTPLSSLRVAFDLLGDSTTMQAIQSDPRQYQRLIGNMQRSLERMERQVADLLDIGYLQASALTLRSRAVDPQLLIASALERTGQLAARRKQTIDVKLTDSAPCVRGDPERLEQVLVNLLSNSLRHTPVNGLLTVEARSEPDETPPVVRFAIADQAPPIPAEDRAAIFEPYYRPTDRSGEPPVDSGLGLAIARALVELHGGRIWVDAGEGAGNTYSFTVPVEQADESPGS